MTAPALETQMQGYLDHLTIERGVAPNTLSSYRRDLRRYSKHLSDRGIHDLAKVGEDDVSEFLVALRRGDPDSGNAALSAVSAARAPKGWPNWTWRGPSGRLRRAGGCRKA